MPLSDKLFIGPPEEREIELGDGTKEILWFRQLDNTAFERYALWNASKDEEVQAKAASRLVALALCNADGSDALTPEQAGRIKRPILTRIIRAIYEVNGLLPALGQPDPNARPPETAPSGSGTSS